MTAPFTILSLGAGVQSSTLALMAATGELRKPDCAIFADTKAEPQSVYTWLDWLETQLPFPVYRISKGDLGEAALVVRTSAGGKNYTKHAVPAFIKDSAGKIGLLMRQCTADFKIDAINRKVRDLREGRHVEMWIGISTDEAHRMKPSRLSYVTHTWPLIDQGMSRKQCLAWLEAQGLPKPPRSSCVFCPYHSNAEWRRLRDDEPDAFAQAVAWEQRLQTTMSLVSNFRGIPWLHRDCVPLSEVDLSEKINPQMELWGNECEGMCGL